METDAKFSPAEYARGKLIFASDFFAKWYGILGDEMSDEDQYNIVNAAFQQLSLDEKRSYWMQGRLAEQRQPLNWRPAMCCFIAQSP